MKLYSPRFVVIALASAALCGVLVSAPAGAADSACKGLEEAKCAAMDGCAWTKEYTRKDGKTVAGHCKKASVPGAKATTKDKGSTPPADMGTGMAPAATATGKAPVGMGTGAGQMPMQKAP